jgi:hypothetical protein
MAETMRCNSHGFKPKASNPCHIQLTLQAEKLTKATTEGVSRLFRQYDWSAAMSQSDPGRETSGLNGRFRRMKVKNSKCRALWLCAPTYH